MKTLLLLSVLLVLAAAPEMTAQTEKKIPRSIRGTITDSEENGVKNVRIFLDMVESRSTTNKRGKYKVKITPEVQLVTIFHPEYGFVNWKYGGEREVNFVFPEDSEPMKSEDFEKLGYQVRPSKKKKENNYASFDSILDILSNSFVQVRVINGEIFIGRRGQHKATGDREPLILVNNVPTPTESLDNIPTRDVKTIEVIHKASEAAAYGFRGANGVIIITLKEGIE